MAGIRTYQDVIARCVPDADTGCKVWLGWEPKTRAHIPVGVIGNKAVRKIRPMRAAWLLAKGPLAVGLEVFPRIGKCPDGCCEIKHLSAMTRKEHGAAVAASGILRNLPHRQAANRLNSRHRITKPGRVKECQDLRAQGLTHKQICRALRMSEKTVRDVLNGSHPAVRRDAVVVPLPLSSVFSWAARRSA